MQDQPTFEYDSTGKITGYKTKVGADTVFPFKGDISVIDILAFSQGETVSHVFEKDYDCVLIVSPYSSASSFLIGTETLSSIKVPTTSTSALVVPFFAVKKNIKKGEKFSCSNGGGGYRHVILLAQ